MRKILIVMIVVILTKPGLAVPGTGSSIEALSDDFEDPSWSFVNNQSSNGIWYGGFRGGPEVCERITPPAGGIFGSTGAIRIRSYDQDGDGYPSQEDLIHRHYTELWDRYLQRADMPSFLVRVWLPDFSTWDQSSSAYQFGCRLEPWTDQANGYYYPSIWVWMETPGNPVFVARIGDGQGSDINLKSVIALDQPGWWTYGFEFDSEGICHYYIKKGVGDLTESDEVWDTTMFNPYGGSDPRMHEVKYNFFSIGYPAGSGLSPDFVIDDFKIFIAEPPEPQNCEELKAAGQNSKADLTGDCIVDIDDLIVLVNDWLSSKEF